MSYEKFRYGDKDIGGYEVESLRLPKLSKAIDSLSPSGGASHLRQPLQSLLHKVLPRKCGHLSP